jgi:hypothetical protein
MQYETRSGDNTTVDVGTLVETSGLGTIFHNCWSIRISGVSVSGFEEFYCTHICIYGMSIIKCD